MIPVHGTGASIQPAALEAEINSAEESGGTNGVRRIASDETRADVGGARKLQAAAELLPANDTTTVKARCP